MRRPEICFLLASILIAIIPFWVWGESLTIDFGLASVFIDGKSTIYILAALMFVYWIIYRVSSRLALNQALTWLHIIITIGIVGLFLATGSWYLKSNASSELQSLLMGQLVLSKERRISLISMKAILFALGQLTFLYNVTSALIRRRS